ncbi:hypothetical protein ABFT80_08160 [Mesorhizobium sp. SB112]|uniref:hypothetical protein n=1 Tax=Mesorhizobium sp. SB112 TaxID=3151853 RepID=UPI003267F73B
MSAIEISRWGTAMIRTDRQVIAELQAVMQRMQELGMTTTQMQRFFDAGEWLLCFEGAWMLVRANPHHALKLNCSYLALETYFADDLI